MNNSTDKKTNSLKEYFYQLIGDDINKIFDCQIPLEITKDMIKKTIEGLKIPNYSVLLEIVEYFGGDKEELDEYIKKDSMLLYAYWDYMFPEATPIKYIGFVVKNLIEKKKISMKSICLKLNMSPSNLSPMLNCKKKFSYVNFEKVINICGMSTMEGIYLLKDSEICYSKKKELIKLITEKRIDKGWTEEEAAEKLDLEYDTYQLIEKGHPIFNVSIIDKLSKNYEIEFYQLLTLAHEANTMLSKKDNISDYLEKNNNSKSYENNDLEQYLCDLIKYDTVMHNNKTINTKNLLIYTLLVLLSDFGESLYEMDIKHYLENITEERTIADDFTKKSGLKLSRDGFTKIFNHYKNEIGMSYIDIEMYTGCVRGTIHTHVVEGNLPNVRTCHKVLSCIGLSPSVGMDAMFDYIKGKIPAETLEKQILLEDIKNNIKHLSQWVFFKKKVPTYKINQILNLAFINISIEDKMEMLRDLQTELE